MKKHAKLLLCGAILFTTLGIHAQNIGINTTGAIPADCSMLDIVSTTKGLLIPRLSLTATATYAPATGTAVEGLIVYNTNSAITGVGAGGSGFYYWSATAARWINLIDNLAPGSAWMLNGNTSVTTPATPATYGTSTIGASENFLGTTDANDIVFGTTNIERMRIKQTNGFVGIGTAAPSTLFHIDGGTGSTTQTIATITGNSLTSGTGMSITSSSLTTGNLVDIRATNASGTTSNSVYVSNNSTTGNAISAVGYGNPNYSTIFAVGNPTVAGTGYDVSNSNHTINAQINNNQPYSFAVIGKVVNAPNPSGGILGVYNSTNCYGALGYFDGTKKGVYGIGLDFGSYSLASGATSNGVVGAGNNIAPVLLASGSGGTFASTNVGVYGYGDATAASYGVYGKSIASAGMGVYGRATISDGDGVDGDNTAASGAGAGCGGFFTTQQTAGAGVAGYLGTTPAYFPGSGVSGIGSGAVGFSGVMGQTTAGASGTGYGITTVNSGTAGQALGNFSYNFGVSGQTSATSTRTGGVLGVQGNYGSWGILGYRSSGSVTYGIYYSAAGAGSGAGFLPSGIITGIGAGGYGGIIGSWTRGDVMGHISAGELFASYNLGNEYTSGYQAEIVTLTDKRVATYAVTATDVKVYHDGTSQLTMGKGRVNFPESFSELVADNKPVVTITPMGQCNGIYISNVDSKGFDVIELNNGNSNVEFSFIVIAKRIDAVNKPDLPIDLAKKDFDQKMKRVMFNENYTEQSASSIWWDGTQIRFDTAPEPKHVIDVKQMVFKVRKEIKEDK